MVDLTKRLQRTLVNAIDRWRKVVYNHIMFTMKRTNKIERLEAQLVEMRKARDEEIRRLYAAGGITYLELAKKFGLTKQRVEKIINKDDED